MNAARDVLASIPIYDGPTYAGEVIELRCGRWEAANATGKLLGAYASQEAAAHAVIFSNG